MKKFQARMLRMDFKKTSEQFIIIIVAFLIVSAVVIGLGCRTQIGEIISLHRQGVELMDVKDRESHDNSESHYSNESNDTNENNYNSENSLSENVGQTKDSDVLEHELLSPLPMATKTVFVVLFVIGGLLGVAYWLLIAMWLYSASVSVSMNGELWFILSLFFNLCAVIAFIVVRSTRVPCPVCGKRQDKSGYCRFCGSKMQVLCGKCGAEIQNLDAYCHNCGAKLKSGEEK